jgi:hypothetical protein
VAIILMCWSIWTPKYDLIFNGDQPEFTIAGGNSFQKSVWFNTESSRVSKQALIHGSAP